MRRFWNLGLSALLLVVLTGCDNLTLKDDGQSAQREQAWQRHVQQMQNWSAWKLEGRAAFLHEDERWTASLVWQQVQQQFDIHLIGPLGQGRLHMQGGPGLVTATAADGQKHMASNPDELMLKTTGMTVPVQALQHWIVGLPSPLSEYDVDLNAEGRLQVLEQDGWHIRYDRYKAIDGVSLPGKLVMKRAGYTVKLVLKQWSAV